MSSIRRSDPEYQQAMREAKELFDAAMAKSSTKGRVGRPKVTPAPAASAATEVEEAEDVAEISALEEIIEVEAAALEDGSAGTGVAMDESAAASERNGAIVLRRRASDG